MKTMIAILALAALGACGGGLRMVVTREQSAWINLQLTGPVTVDRDGNIFVLTPSNVARCDADAHEVEELLFEHASMSALAAVPGGPLLVLSGHRLEAVVAGKRIKLADLPGEGLRLAAGEEAAYLVVSVHGEYALLRYRFEDRTLELYFRTFERIEALTVVPGGCLVAVGRGIHKIFDPRDGQIARRLILAVSEGPITGLACDVDGQMIYFSDGSATYGWNQGIVRTILPLGGSLAVSNGTLVVADRNYRQILAVTDLP